MLKTMILPGSSGSIYVDNVLVFNRDRDIVSPLIRASGGLKWWRNTSDWKQSVTRVSDHWKKDYYHGVIAAEQGATLAYQLYIAGLLPKCMYMILIAPDSVDIMASQHIKTSTDVESCPVVVMLPEVAYDPGAFDIIRDMHAVCVKYFGGVESWTQDNLNYAFECVNRRLMNR